MGLKEFREYKLKETRAEFAQRIGETEETIKLWEEDEDNLGLKIIEKIMQKTGADFNTVTGYQKPVPKPVIPDNTWEKAESTKDGLAKYISNGIVKLGLPKDLQKSYVDGLQQCLESYLVKPKITVVGRSDTGKSTLINTMLGAEKMPASWTPTTSIAVYIKHIEDKPAFIPEDEDVWVFANHHGDENLWDVRRLRDEEYCRSWKIASGDINTLHTYGTRQDKQHAFEAGSAVVFLDAPILRNCDIIDVPGFGTDEKSDDLLTLKASQGADAIVYLSQANGFMRQEDFIYLKENINSLPVWEKQGANLLKPLCNLFVVASQAHNIDAGNINNLHTILQAGHSTLSKALPEHYWAAKCHISGYSEEDYSAMLSRRFFTYTTDIPDLCAQFSAELKILLEALPDIINNRAKEAVKAYIAERKPSLQAAIEKNQSLCSERERFVSLLQDIEEHENERLRDNDKRKSKVVNKINEFKQESLEELRAYYSWEITTESVVKKLHEQKVKNKKEEIEQFTSRFQSMIRQKVEEILSEKSRAVTEATKEYIDDFSMSISNNYSEQSLKVDFNAGWAFTSAISSFGIWGGLGAGVAGWAAAILMPTSLFLGSAGTAALVAGLLGPVGLVGGLAVGGVLGVVKLFGGGWEKSVAKNMIKAFEEKDIQGMYAKCIETYWDETLKAFEKASDSLEAEWKAYVEQLRKSVNEYDIDELENRLLRLKNLVPFYENIPL